MTNKRMKNRYRRYQTKWGTSGRSRAHSILQFKDGWVRQFIEDVGRWKEADLIAFEEIETGCHWVAQDRTVKSPPMLYGVGLCDTPLGVIALYWEKGDKKYLQQVAITFYGPERTLTRMIKRRWWGFVQFSATRSTDEVGNIKEYWYMWEKPGEEEPSSPYLPTTKFIRKSWSLRMVPS